MPLAATDLSDLSVAESYARNAVRVNMWIFCDHFFIFGQHRLVLSGTLSAVGLVRVRTMIVLLAVVHGRVEAVVSLKIMFNIFEIF